MLVAGAFDPRALATIEWLARNHEVPVSAYSVSMVRFGGERLLSVRREPSEAGAKDPSADVQWLLSGGVAGGGVEAPRPAPVVASTPPPGT